MPPCPTPRVFPSIGSDEPPPRGPHTVFVSTLTRGEEWVVTCAYVIECGPGGLSAMELLYIAAVLVVAYAVLYVVARVRRGRR